MADPRRDLRVALLGPLRVEVSGSSVEIPLGHQRRLLAALALAAGRAVPTDRLVDLLWGDDPPASARNSLQSHIARLRQNLGGAHSVVRDGRGYLLAATPDDVDAVRFDRVVDEASTTDDPARRRGLLDQALALWRTDDPALDGDGLLEEARLLRRRRLAAQVARADVALATGDLVTAEADTSAVLRSDPFHEPAVVLLVRVLAAAGRVAEADVTVQRFRDRLAGELGLDPSPALGRVHTALVRGELSPAGATGPVPAPPPAVVRPAGRVAEVGDRGDDRGPSSTRPALPRSSLRGRREDLDALASAVAAERCVTVVGPGGVGKTRLAVEHVHRERRGVVWADLLDVSTRADIVGRLAVAAECGTPSDLVTLSPLAEELTARGALVVLDNCEQAVADVAAIVDALLHASRGTTVLATSRTPLAVDGEHVVPLSPLPATDAEGRSSAALQLFADRVGRALDLGDVDQRQVAEQVVAALDGLPLALELAARQARNLGLAALRDRLDDRLDLLADPRPGEHPAHADLRSLVRWSTDQLDEPDRRAFGWLSVFTGMFTLGQAEELLGADGATVPAPAASVGRLVEQSLVVRRPPDRFLLLETLRVCAAEEIEERDETAAARSRHTELVLTAAEAADQQIGTEEEATGLTAMNALVADLQAVTDRLVDDSDVRGLCRLSCAVREFAYETQRPELLRAARVAARLLTEGTATAAEAVPSALRDGAMVAAAVEASARGDTGQARLLVAPVLAAEPSSPAAGPAWNVLGDTRLWGVEDDAVGAYTEAARLSEEAGDPFAAHTGLIGVALAHAYVGDIASAREVVEQVEARAQRLGSPLVRAWSDYARAETDADHDPDAALAAYERAIARARTVGGHLVVAAASSGAAAVRARHGDPADVLPHVRDTLGGLRGSGNANVQQSVLRNVSVLLTRLGSDAAAATVLGATSSDALYEAERRRVQLARSALVERLGDEEFRRRVDDGARMAATDVVDVALAAVEHLLTRSAPPSAKPDHS